MINNPLFLNTLKEYNIGLWQLGDSSFEDQWSAELYAQFGLPANSKDSVFEYFMRQLLHKDDCKFFKICYQKYREQGINFKCALRIKNVQGNYHSFNCFSAEEAPLALQSNNRLIFFQRETAVLNEENPFYKTEKSSIAKIGSWSVDFKTKHSFWDVEAKRILGYPDDYQPSLAKSADYYAPEHRQQAANTFLACSTSGTPFKTEIKMLTSQGKEIWVSSIGRPVYDDKNRIVGIKGVFQDIDATKKRELGLEHTVAEIASQNDKLFNFAHIVSHNLRSHSSNLHLLVQLIESTPTAEEKLDLLSEVKTISASLTTTIAHLNEIVAIHGNKNKDRQLVNFESILLSVMGSIQNIIDSSNAQVTFDFSAAPNIDYLPAYMESILLNLMTNAIKYKHPDRIPKIHFTTETTSENKIRLRVADNGSGINMEKYGKHVFGMYKTFHYNNDAVGVGLFMTRNQVESLGGNISVESKENEGTTFIIDF